MSEEFNANNVEPKTGAEQVALRSVAVPNVESRTPDAPELDAPELELDGLGLLRLDPAVVTIERIVGWIFTGVVLLVGLIVLGVVAFNVGLTNIVTGVCLMIYILISAFLVWATHVLPKKAYEHAGWILTASGLEIRSGIWWRSQISVPLVRVQHTDVHQGPLMRKFGLAKLIVHTAGTENSAVELNGLSFATAQRLRDALIENRGALDGV